MYRKQRKKYQFIFNRYLLQSIWLQYFEVDFICYSVSTVISLIELINWPPLNRVIERLWRVYIRIGIENRIRSRKLKIWGTKNTRIV